MEKFAFINALVIETKQVSRTQIRALLDGLIVYIRLHAPVMNDFRSHEVLKTVLE